MFGSEILEVAIGVAFVFLLVSVIASAVREALEALLHTRAAYLERGIRELLHDREATNDGLARVFYSHPLIYSLFGSEYKPGKVTGTVPIFVVGRGLPSYIPAKNFAVALMDIAVRGPVTDAVSGDAQSPEFTLETMRQNISQLGNPAVQRVLLTAIDSAHGDVQAAQLNVQAWFDSGMDRVSGWYKRATSWILFWVGMAVAVLFNVDAISAARYLYHNDAVRAVVVANAERASSNADYLSTSYEQAKQDLLGLSLPIGWDHPVEDATGQVVNVPWYQQIGWQTPLGWLITALAATVGAPFWFDLLNKFMVIRSTVKPHEKSREESSEDRQRPPPRVVEAPPVVTLPATTVAPLTTAPLTTTALGPQHPQPGRLRDVHSGIDACDVEMDPAKAGGVISATADEDLPPAEGGVV